jgi:hypothetical protein
MAIFEHAKLPLVGNVEQVSRLHHSLTAPPEQPTSAAQLV